MVRAAEGHWVRCEKRGRDPESLSQLFWEGGVEVSKKAADESTVAGERVA